MDLLTELTRANHDPAVIAKVRALLEQSAKAEQVLDKNNATLAEKDFKIAALTLEFHETKHLGSAHLSLRLQSSRASASSQNALLVRNPVPLCDTGKR